MPAADQYVSTVTKNFEINIFIVDAAGTSKHVLQMYTDILFDGSTEMTE